MRRDAPRRPPAPARWLIAALAPAPAREPVLGDLEESFHARADRDGAAAAAAWYWRQALGSAPPLAAALTRSSLAVTALVAVLAGYWLGIGWYTIAIHGVQRFYDSGVVFRSDVGFFYDGSLMGLSVRLAVESSMNAVVGAVAALAAATSNRRGWRDLLIVLAVVAIAFGLLEVVALMRGAPAMPAPYIAARAIVIYPGLLAGAALARALLARLRG
ncbi:hypothetical protein DDZ18_10680 [Marinicauda salina]|uniref:Uncharacterized protein n=1 Tax=Marinicauda salina TaxID=2135793 RepID=A0A2U2BRM5_9PROT|nr:permease prefix domain 2-containing transporter [Marinicauda salina]PWE16667.1 hypothetical protein DDZ18_10680 [Marinicauda salina]